MSNELHTLFEMGDVLSLKKDETLFHTGEPVRAMYLVIEGQVDLVRYLKTGTRMLLLQGYPGQVLAEASAYSQNYHCDCVAAQQSILQKIPLNSFLHQLEANNRLARIWAEKLAQALQRARLNSEIRTLRTVGERLDAWQSTNGTLPQKGQRLHLAQTLGVSREALYRELAKRRS